MNRTKLPTFRPHFSLRFLLVLTGVVALCLFTARNSDWIAGVGLFVAFMLFAVARSLGKRQVNAWARLGMVAFAMVIGWFAAVDQFYSKEHCPRCRSHHNRLDYRLLGISITN